MVIVEAVIGQEDRPFAGHPRRAADPEPDPHPMGDAEHHDQGPGDPATDNRRPRRPGAARPRPWAAQPGRRAALDQLVTGDRRRHRWLAAVRDGKVRPGAEAIRPRQVSQAGPRRQRGTPTEAGRRPRPHPDPPPGPRRRIGRLREKDVLEGRPTGKLDTPISGPMDALPERQPLRAPGAGRRGGTADAEDLKSSDGEPSCGFDSHRRHSEVD